MKQLQRTSKRIFLINLAALTVTTAGAKTLEERVAALEAQNETLTEEILAEQTEGFTLVDTKKSYNGLGPAASKVYYAKSPLSIGGYGEMYYADPDNGDDYADVYRFITYFGYKFSENVILNAEIEFEHGGNPDDGGEVAIEFMYLDLLWREEMNVRIGNLLVPMGLINLRHEPILFNTVQRPEVENKLLPSTWQENGVLIYGRLFDGGVSYTFGMINALNLNSDATAIADSGWIRSGRIGSSAKAPFDPAFVGRLDYTALNGLLVGVSLYYGGASNLKDPLPTDPIQDISGLDATMFDIHVNYESGPFRAYGLYTQTVLEGAEKISSSAVEKANGYYMNFSYDVDALTGLGYKMPLFVQYEDFNPVASTVDGLNEEKYKTKTTTVGLNFFPVDQAVFKVDYTMKEVGGEDQNIFSMGLGFVF